MGKHCQWRLCHNNSDNKSDRDRGVIWVPFPKLKTNPYRCKLWVKRCNAKKLHYDHITKNHYVCSDHFVKFNFVAGIPNPANPDPIACTNADIENYQSTKPKRRFRHKYRTRGRTSVKVVKDADPQPYNASSRSISDSCYIVCPCCDSKIKNETILQEHLMTFHKMNKDFAIGFLIRRALLQQIITTRGPLICKKCNEPMDEQDITRHLNGYPTLLTEVKEEDECTTTSGVKQEINAGDGRTLQLRQSAPTGDESTTQLIQSLPSSVVEIKPIDTQESSHDISVPIVPQNGYEASPESIFQPSSQTIDVRNREFLKTGNTDGTTQRHVLLLVKQSAKKSDTQVLPTPNGSCALPNKQFIVQNNSQNVNPCLTVKKNLNARSPEDQSHQESQVVPAKFRGIPGNSARDTQVLKMPNNIYMVKRVGSKDVGLKRGSIVPVLGNAISKLEPSLHREPVPASSDSERQCKKKSFYCNKCEKLFPSWSVFEDHSIKNHKISKRELLLQRIVQPDDQIQNMNGIKYVIHKNLCDEIIYCLECVLAYGCWKDFKEHLHCSHGEEFSSLDPGGSCKLQILPSPAVNSESIEGRKSDILVRDKWQSTKTPDPETSSKQSEITFSTPVNSDKDKQISEKLGETNNIPSDSGVKEKDQITTKRNKLVQNGKTDSCHIDNPTMKLRDNNKALTDTKDEISYDCKGCSSHFLTWGTFNDHCCTDKKVSVRLSKRIHTCHECGCSYSYKYDLKQHYKTHGTPLYVCEICGFQSSRTQTFKNHMNNRHLKLRPFKCPHPLCNKRFFNNAMLTGHLAVHTSERKFNCKQCKKKYKTSGHLRRHMLSHRPTNKRHSCPFCPGTFTFVCNMKTHIKNIHQGAQDYTVRRKRKNTKKT